MWVRAVNSTLWRKVSWIDIENKEIGLAESSNFYNFSEVEDFATDDCVFQMTIEEWVSHED